MYVEILKQSAGYHRVCAMRTYHEMWRRRSLISPFCHSQNALLVNTDGFLWYILPPISYILRYYLMLWVSLLVNFLCAKRIGVVRGRACQLTLQNLPAVAGMLYYFHGLRSILVLFFCTPYIYILWFCRILPRIIGSSIDATKLRFWEWGGSWITTLAVFQSPHVS